MNKRIRELAVQAFRYADQNSRDGDDVSHGRLYREKFAELIVEECVAQCWTVSELEHKGSIISECSKRMRKHFGVEE